MAWLGTEWHDRYFTGTWELGGTAGAVESRDKATDELLGTVAVSSQSEVRAAGQRAQDAQAAWSTTTATDRRAVLVAAAAALDAHRMEVEDWLVRETGGVRPKAQAEIKMAMDELLEAAALPTRPLGHVVAPSEPGMMSVTRRVPRGVVGVIAPWNFPLILGLRSVAPALALGNAVILKPSPETPVSGGVLIARLFEEAALPPGVLHVLNGDAETGEAIVTDPNVRMISFTGSTEVGRRISSLAAPLLKKVALELGGNNAFIVLDDADLDAASSAGAWGSFLHQGQICMTAGRHIVHERVAEQYAARLAERAGRLPIGDPFKEEVAIGPIVSTTQLSRVEQIVGDAVAAGATVVAGGAAQPPYYPPTVLTGVTPAMRAFSEEIFGPVAPITVVRSDEEAVSVANDTPYGLAAAVQSGSPGRALEVANQLRAGLVHVNDQTVNYESYIPFGGTGSSGNGGRFGGEGTLDEFTEWQWLTVRGRAHSYPF